MVSRPNFMTRAFIVMAVFAAFIGFYFAVPQFRSVVTSVATTIRTNLGSWAAALTTSQFYITLIAPRLWLISMIVGGLIVGIIAIFAVRGYLDFIKFGRVKSQELAGYQTQPIHQPIPIQPTQPTPITQLKPEGEG